MKWTDVDDDTQRAPIPGGWLLWVAAQTMGDGFRPALCFVPDPNHLWVIGREPCGTPMCLRIDEHTHGEPS